MKAKRSTRASWVAFVVVLTGIFYGLVGIIFALPSNHAHMWRLAAWVTSGAAYAGHIWYEQFRARSSRFATALHVAMAVALGAFLLAVGATVHAAIVQSHTPIWRFRLALVLWPVITAVPAFLVALAASFVLTNLNDRS